MVWREARATWPRLVFFFLCVGLGVASIIVLRSVVQHVRSRSPSEARSLVAADIVLQSHAAVHRRAARSRSRPLAAAQRRRSARRALVDTQTMAARRRGRPMAPSSSSNFAAWRRAFPFYGRLELEGGVVVFHALLGESRRGRAAGTAGRARHRAGRLVPHGRRDVSRDGRDRARPDAARRHRVRATRVRRPGHASTARRCWDLAAGRRIRC